MTPEGYVKNQICSYLKSIGIFFFVHDSVGIYNAKRKAFMKNKSPYRIVGVSDLLGCLPDGRMLAIEVKAPTNKKGPTDEQQAFIDNVNGLGGVAFVARSVEDVKTILLPRLRT